MPEVNITKKGWKCLRCGHEWEQKEGFDNKNKPKTCPKCRSVYWDVPRKKKGENK